LPHLKLGLYHFSRESPHFKVHCTLELMVLFPNFGKMIFAAQVVTRQPKVQNIGVLRMAETVSIENEAASANGVTPLNKWWILIGPREKNLDFS